jgi:protein-disulfide isomerase
VTLHAVEQKYGADVRVVYKSLVVHPDIGTLPALAACAAQQQGKFWEMEAAIFDGVWDVSGDQPEVKDATLVSQEGLDSLAGKIGLDMTRFHADMQGATCTAYIEKNAGILSTLAVHATPTFYVNGRFIGGAVPQRELEKIIDEEKAKAEAAYKSGVKPEDYYQTLVSKGLKSP